MYIDNVVTEDSIFQEMDDICGSDKVSYSYKRKVARLNNAQNRYFELAFKSGKEWNFDDINETSPPIDTQDIVSGTNRYKMSDFTAKILSVIKLEILNSSGTGLVLIPETINNLRVINPANQSGRLNTVYEDTFQELYLNAPSGTPTHYAKYGDFIYLRPKPDYSLSAALKVYFDRTLARIAFERFTVTVATPGVFSATAHGLVANDTVVLVTDGALPTGLTNNTTYYVISAGLTADAFQVSATLGGSAVNTTGTQSGVHTFLKTNYEPGVPEVHHQFLANHASLQWLGDKVKANWEIVNNDVAKDELAITKYFSERGKDVRPRLGAQEQNNK